MRSYAPIALLVLVFASLGTLYVVLTPDWQAPDEPAHYNYVRQLAGGEFPVIEAGDYDQEYQSLVISSRFSPVYSVESFEYEDYQPPLYYLLQTPIFWLFAGRLEGLRLFSLLLGAGVIVLTYLVARRLFPGRDWLALTAAAFVAFLPQHMAMMAAVNNDSLAELLIAAILLVLLSLVSGKAAAGDNSVIDRRRYLLLGLLLGLGFLTKVTVYIMAPVVGLVLLWRHWGNWRTLVRGCLFVFGTALALGLIWWIRNLAVYGGSDFLGTGAHNAIVVGQPQTAEWIAEKGLFETVQAFFQTTFQSFWGQFGWMGVVMPAWVYLLLLLFSLLTLLGLGVAAWQMREGRRDPGEGSAMGLPTRTAALILISVLALSLLVYLFYNLTFVQHQGRYLYPALIPISIGVALAWGAVVTPLGRRMPAACYLLPAGLALLLAGLDLLALFRFILPSLAG